MLLPAIRLLATAHTPDQFPGTDQLEIVLAGRSNVGKSLLLNRLAKTQKRDADSARARVSCKPGCTRSINFFSFWPDTRVVDLPGYGFARLPVAERQRLGRFVEQYLRHRPNIALILHVIDARLPLQKLDWQLLEWGKHFRYFHLLALNKCDKLSRSAVAQRRREVVVELAAAGYNLEVIPISAATGFGLPELSQRLKDCILNFQKGVFQHDV